MRRIGLVSLLMALLVPIFSASPVRAATFVVTTTVDGGAGSLRAAVDAANLSPGSTITFNIAGGGVHTIVLGSNLAGITQPTVVDATTQPGYAGVPLIEINGGNVSGTSNAFALIGGNSTIKGFTINNFHLGGTAASGIAIVSSGNTIQANYIGTDASGTVAAPNSIGIHIFPLSGSATVTGNVIGGTTAAARNVISASDFQGILIDGNSGANVSGNVVEGNYFGTNAAGTAVVKHPTNVGSNGYAIEIAGAGGNLIGGTATGAANVISGGQVDNFDKGAGILVNGTAHTAVGNVIQGNLIGTDKNGIRPIANATGIYISASKNTQVGGTTAAARNIISGSVTAGIEVDGSSPNPNGTSATGNTIQGNYIGTDLSGTAAVPNNHGIVITNASDNLVGGTATGTANVISGNTSAGVILEVTLAGGATQRNLVQGNLIGTNASGNAPLGQAFGVSINGGSSNTIGGTTAAARNIIADYWDRAAPGAGAGILLFNNAANNTVQGNYFGTDTSATLDLESQKGTGVFFSGASTNTIGGVSAGTGNVIANSLRGVAVVNSNNDSIVGNAIYASNADSINLDQNGNNGQAKPTLTSAVSFSPGQIAVSGTISSTGAAPFLIEFFSTPNAVAEMRVFLGSAVVNNGAFTAHVSTPHAGNYITATATDSNGNTSAVSVPRQYIPGPAAIVTPNPSSNPQSAPVGTAYRPLAVTVTDAKGNPVGAGVSVTFSAPTTGASGTFSNNLTTIQARTDGSGMTSVAFTANMVVGQFSVIASVAGGSTAATFSLNNTVQPAPPSRPGPSQPGTPNVSPGSRGGPSAPGKPSFPIPR
jgi:hypothetical protein